MRGGKRSQVHLEGSLLRHLWRPYGGKVSCKEDYESGLFLANHATRRRRFHQEMWQLLEVWERPKDSRGKDNYHLFTMTIRTMGNWHHVAPTTRKEASKIFARLYWLLHKVGGGRGLCHDHISKGTKFCMEKHCVQVRDPTGDRLE